MGSHHRRAEDDSEVVEQPAVPATEQPIAERIAELDAQRKELVEKIRQQKAETRKVRKAALLHRNESVSKEGAVVISIQREIYAYNKLSKKRKSEFGILAKIACIIEDSTKSG